MTFECLSGFIFLSMKQFWFDIICFKKLKLSYGRKILYKYTIMNAVSEQDWTPVVWKKKPPSNAKQAKSRPGFTVATQTRGSASGQRMAKIDRTEIGTIAKVNAKLAKAIKQAREAKKMSQKDFATATSLPLAVVSGYEAKKAQPKQGEIIKMQRVLGVYLTGKHIGQSLK